MKRYGCVHLFLLVLFTGETSLTAMQSLTLRGEIADAAGAPLQGDLTVVTGGKNVASWSLQTNSIGTFSFQVPEGTPLTVVAKANGYLSAEISVVAQTDAPALHFRLSMAGRVSGRVIDEMGKGIPDAQLAIRYVEESRAVEFSQEIADVATDDFGYFTFTSVARDRPFTIDVADSSHPLVASPVMTLDRDSLIGVLVTVHETGQVVRGRVLDAHGQPLSNIRVHMNWRPESRSNARRRELDMSVLHIYERSRSTTTRSDGSFEFRGVAEGVVIVNATNCGRPVSARGELTANTPFEATLTLSCVAAR